VFGRGYGHDTVDASDSASGKHDKIRLVGLSPEEVEFGMARRASFLLRLFGLVTLLFLQVAMDKALVPTALAALGALTIGFLAAPLFEVAPGPGAATFSAAPCRASKGEGVASAAHLKFSRTK